MQGETVWLTQQQMAELFQTSRTNVVEHIRHIYEEGELDEDLTCRSFRQVRLEGGREVARELPFYNLDMIISLGYRVKSGIATNFRRWATARLKEYMIKGFTMDDERLKGSGGGNYWKELLDRIRDIRSSEKVLYRQVLDLYATSVDYDPRSETSIQFFKVVQNKLHYAAHGHTAAEVIYQRANAQKPFMGLKAFAGEFPAAKDIGVAKNYLDENELKILNNLVSGYFDFAEISALEHSPMYMADYVSQLDAILSSDGRKILADAGSVSHTQALQMSTGIFDVLFAHEDRPVLDVQVIPEEGNQLALSQTADQLQIEHWEYSSGIGGVEVGFQLFGSECLHLYLLHLGGDTVIGRVAGDEPLLHRSFECAMEHEVDASDCSAGIAVTAPMVHPAMLHSDVPCRTLKHGSFFSVFLIFNHLSQPTGVQADHLRKSPDPLCGAVFVGRGTQSD